MSLLPNSELVTVAWLKDAVPYLGGRVATSLPADNSSWAASGFVTVSTVGGDPDIYLGWRRPVMSIDVWGAATDSGKPPWNLTAQQAEQIRDATLVHQSVGRPVVTPDAYRSARVGSVFLRTEPQRIRGDVANYAHYSFDLELWWTVIG